MAKAPSIDELLEQRYGGSTPRSVSPRSSIDDLLQQRYGGGIQKPQPKLFQGGFIQDIFDAISVPQYIATGALSNKYTIKEALQNRIAPSQALGITKPGEKNSIGRAIAGFAADVVLDPLNFVGIGALSKLGKAAAKKGAQKATLGAAGRAGERNLFSIINPLTGDEIAPLIKGAPVLEGITSASQAFKNTGVGKSVSDAFNLLPGVSKGKDVEDVTKQLANVKDALLTSKGVERGTLGMFADATKRIAKEADGLVNAGVLNKADLEDVLEKISNPLSKVTIKKEALPVYRSLKANFDELTRAYAESGGKQLKGKVTKSVLTKEARDALAESARPGMGGRKVGRKAGIENFASYTGFRSIDNAVTLTGRGSGKTKAVLENGQTLKKIGNDESALYVTKEIAEQIEVAKAKAVVAASKMERTARAKFIKDAVEAEIKKLKAQFPSDFFERIGLSSRSINEGNLRRAEAVGKAAYDKAFKSSKAKKMSPAEREAFAQAASEAAKAKLGLASFSEDPFETLLGQATDVAKMTGRNAFVKAVKEGGIGKAWPKRKAPPAGFRRVDIEGLKDFIFDDQVADAMEVTNKAYTATGAVKDMLDTFDKVQNLFKASATFVNPAFHTRNYVSNMWQLHLAGVKNPEAHAKGIEIASLAFRAKRAGKPITDLMSASDAKLFKEMVESEGLLKVGPFSVDIDTPTFKWTDDILELPGDIGELVESTAKIALYFDRKSKGFTSRAAARDVRKFLFDYSDLSSAEREVFKRVMPFYTWTRKNLPLQVSMLIQDPTKFNVIEKAKRAVESMTDGEPLDEKYLPGWLKDGYAIYLGEGENGLQNFFKAEGYIPAIDIGRIGKPGATIMQNISPLFKTPVEIALNYDTFTKREIKEYPGQKQFLGIPFTSVGTEVDPYIMKLLRTFRPFSESQKFVQDPAKARGNQMSTVQALMSYLIGKTYAIDPMKQRNVFDYVQGQTISDIENDIEDARKRGQQKAIPDLQELLRRANSGQGISI